MAKKSFKKNNPALQFITEAHEDQEALDKQEEQNKQDAQEVIITQQKQEEPIVSRKETLTSGTQGRKGQKLPRINMAFAEENLEYLQWISRLEGCSMTEYVNRLLQKDRENRAETIEKFRALLDS